MHIIDGLIMVVLTFLFWVFLLPMVLYLIFGVMLFKVLLELGIGVIIFVIFCIVVTNLKGPQKPKGLFN